MKAKGWLRGQVNSDQINMRIPKAPVAALLLFLLAVMPMVWVLVRERRVDASGLSYFEIVEAAREGRFDDPFGALWTIFVTFAGVVLVMPKGLRFFKARSSAFVLFLAVSMVSLAALSFLFRPGGVVPFLGQQLRFIDYFLLAPLLTVLALPYIERLLVPIYLAHTALALALVFPELGTIDWAAITQHRAIGSGGAQTGIGAGYLGVLFGLLLLQRTTLMLLDPSLTRQVLGWIAATLALLVIIITFTRGALLGILIASALYAALRSSRSPGRLGLYLILVGALAVVAAFAADWLLYVASRQGALGSDSLDAGRIARWREVVEAGTASPEAFFFGPGPDAIAGAAENFLMGVFLNHGFLTALAYVVFNAVGLWLMWRLVQRSRDPMQRDLLFRALATCVGLLTVASTGNTFYLMNGMAPYVYYYLLGLTIVLQGRRALPRQPGVGGRMRRSGAALVPVARRL
jgi:hypothetical protein